MNDLIKALQIFLKYDNNTRNPFSCEHDELYITCVQHEDVSAKDKAILEKLGFSPHDAGGFVSYRFGSS